LFAIAKRTESPSLAAYMHANGLVGSTANLKECGRTHDFMAAAPIALADALSAGGIMGRGGGQFVGCVSAEPIKCSITISSCDIALFDHTNISMFRVACALTLQPPLLSPQSPLLSLQPCYRSAHRTSTSASRGNGHGRFSRSMSATISTFAKHPRRERMHLVSTRRDQRGHDVSS